MSETKITYLLGAGASANCVPVVEKFTPAVKGFLKELVDYSDLSLRFRSPNIHAKPSKVKEQMLTACDQIIDEAQAHVTFDTYAKKLYLTGRTDDLRRLKALLSLFLINHQLNNSVDQRYDVFFATILKSDGYNLKLPDSINILTWNYDFQLEQAASAFFQESKLASLQKFLGVYPNNTEKANTSAFSVIKLNGTAAGYISHTNKDNYSPINFDLSLSREEQLSQGIWENILEYYYWTAISPNLNTRFAVSFAWEDEEHVKICRNITDEVIQLTTHLVIIGYSFPTFNRYIDKGILSKMYLLEKVTIQTMENTAEEVTNRFSALLGVTEKRGEQLFLSHLNRWVSLNIIKMKSGNEEFHIPFEFTGQ